MRLLLNVVKLITNCYSTSFLFVKLFFPSEKNSGCRLIPFYGFVSDLARMIVDTFMNTTRRSC